MTIKCAQCGHQNSDDTEFCENCGAQLPVPVPAGVAAAGVGGIVAAPVAATPVSSGPQLACPSCKAPLALGDEFCFNCGTDVRAITGSQPLVAPAQPQPQPAPASPVDPNDAAINKALAELDGNNNAAPDPASPAAPDPGPLVPVAVSAPPAPDPAPVANAFSAPPAAPAPAPASTPVPVAVPGGFQLNISGPYGDEVVEWKGRELLLGRNDPKTRIFPDVNLDDSAASRRHLSIWKESADGLYYAQDLESANGTILNGRDLRPGEPTELHNGDVLKIGTRYTIQIQIG